MTPSPLHDVAESVLSTGAALVVRPIRPDDEPMLVRFHEELSDQSVYQRYFHMMTLAHRTSHARLARVCGVDGDRECVLVGVARDGERGAPAIFGVGRLGAAATAASAEFAVVVADRYQGIGVGGALLRHIVAVARQEGCAAPARGHPRGQRPDAPAVRGAWASRWCRRPIRCVVERQSAPSDQPSRSTTNDRLPSW